MTTFSKKIKSVSTLKSESFLTENFLLENEAAKNLYFNYAKDLPIIDYHSHLPPNQIANNKKFENLTELWLKGDHYKWRAMRTLGVNEKFITGNASDEEKFTAWANCFPQLIRSPLFHWSQMELKNPFGIEENLNLNSAPVIYEYCNELLNQNEFSTKSLLSRFKVEMVGTTDDPCDDLAHHKQISDDICLSKLQGFQTKVLPSFRPDKFLNITERTPFITNLEKLEIVSGVKIKSFSSFLEALENRINYFHDHGCRISDHGLIHMPLQFNFNTDLENEFSVFIENKKASVFSQPECFAGAVLISLCRLYHAKGWVQQFHLGPLRNNNSRLLNILGHDAGVDSIGDYTQANALSNFLNVLDQQNELAKTILYNINPAYNEVFATMCGNFNDGTIKGKVQYGSGWWFLDQKDGIEKQINTLSNMGVVSTFIGMITDSRSFLSYSRHEYFRRVLCNIFGTEMEKGFIPNDEKWIGDIIQNICYYNAKEYFNFS
jgi:glucuronate isomerase